MAGINGIFLMNFDQVITVIINFLNKANGLFVCINHFYIATPTKTPAGALTPITTPAVWQLFPILKRPFIFFAGCHTIQRMKTIAIIIHQNKRGHASAYPLRLLYVFGFFVSSWLKTYSKTATRFRFSAVTEGIGKPLKAAAYSLVYAPAS